MDNTADSPPITYDLGAYAALDQELQAAPERYLARYFSEHIYATATATDVASPELQYVRMAPNNSHPVHELAGSGGEVAIEFSEAVRKSVIRGKAKKQSLRVQPDTKLCTVRAQGREFAVRAAVRGTLVEWNTRLADDPLLLVRHPDQAFFAIVKPHTTTDDAAILAACKPSVV
ncbi:hypothetical protein H4R18_004757 [Coemansia javaensis]|uniref:Protein Abitram n=1 Tax=Coemansia javaensis TaxID=2761396 RepID=A0A9W8LEE2_9FUNG|nr:hypothetical protein H4R18_004757 [Coemansia javaensis]